MVKVWELLGCCEWCSGEFGASLSLLVSDWCGGAFLFSAESVAGPLLAWSSYVV